MSRFRKTAALLACAVIASTVTGCSDTTYSIKFDGEEVKAGVYIGYLQNELTNQLYMLSNTGDTDDVFSNQVDGKSLSDYVKDNSLKDIKEYAGIKKQFAAEGLTLSDDELKEMNTGVKNSWDSMGELYEYDGVSKESLKEIYRESLMRSKLFDHYYGTEGKEAPSAEDIQKYVNENYVRYKIISIYKSTETDETKKKEENDAKLKERDDLYEKGKDYSYEDFDKLIDEYNESQKVPEDDSSTPDESTPDESTADESKTDASAADESTSDSSTADENTADASSADETSSLTETDTSVNAAAPDEGLVTTGPDDSDKEIAAGEVSGDSSVNADSSSEAAEDTSSANSDDAASDTEAGPAEDTVLSAADPSSKEDIGDGSIEVEDVSGTEEADPFKNDVMINLASYTDKDFETESGKLYKFIKGADKGKVLTFENENAYYIVIKEDPAGYTGYAEENRDTIVQTMKKDDFQSKIDSWVEAANISVNDKAIKRYTPEVIYDRMNEYYEEQSKKK
ncbi:MAG: hypothetical protein IKO27_05725 [Ruminococcus sp.]|nr:hypothetical protein [Ruminococcus sp.]